MNIETFKSFKNSSNVLILSEQINNLISLLSVGNKKISKNYNKGGNQLLKNPKMQVLKDKIENKVNLVLNKLSETNLHNLLYEFIESMNKLSMNDYLEIQKAFYIKMQTDISFVNIYLEFFKIISNIYKEVYNYNSDFFYKIIEIKFLIDYTEDILELPDNLLFLNDYNEETKRVNNLIIIKKMIKNSMFLPIIQTDINKKIVDQNKYFADIYYWFQNDKLSTELKDQIKNKITNNSLPLREKVLLDNLLGLTKISVNNLPPFENSSKSPFSPVSIIAPKNKTIIKNSTIEIDTLKLETENILEEYLNLDEIDDMKNFIEDRCKDAWSKNKFCQYIFDKYFEISIESSTKILELIKLLIKKQILYKSNLSRGILLIYNNWNDVSLDYNNPNKKMKELLTCLKNMGITKYLESLLKTYKIEYEI